MEKTALGAGRKHVFVFNVEKTLSSGFLDITLPVGG